MNKRDTVHWQQGMFYNKKIKIGLSIGTYNSKDEKLNVYDSSNLFNIQVLQSRN